MRGSKVKITAHEESLNDLAKIIGGARWIIDEMKWSDLTFLLLIITVIDLILINKRLKVRHRIYYQFLNLIIMGSSNTKDKNIDIYV